MQAPRSFPTNILNAERALHDFDTASSVGPKLSCTRFELLARIRKFTAVDEWEWVAEILQRFPTLGHLKPSERYQCGQTAGATGRVPRTITALLGPRRPPDQIQLERPMSSTGSGTANGDSTSDRHLFNPHSCKLW